jgi:hypothetical protein
MRLFLVALILSLVALPVSARNKKVQEVAFEGSEVDGEGRNPDGAYLVQKRGVKFLPLYKVKEQFDDNIKDSVEYLR